MLRYLPLLLLLALPAYAQEPALCPIPGERVQWIADLCMSRLSTDDEIAASDCIAAELQFPFSDDCAAKRYYKGALCALALSREEASGRLENCLEDPEFIGPTVRGGGVGGLGEPQPEASNRTPVGEIAEGHREEAVILEYTGYKGFFQRIRQGFSLHRENYLLPLTWGNQARAGEDAELKFQFSFRQQLWRGLNIGYTQKSFWRVLDQEDSRPFRETNYNPELFYRWQFVTTGGRGWGTDLGIEHESNGNREPSSRSWNRVYLTPFFDYGPLHVELKLWQRLAEEAKKTPEDTSGDENPDIVDFYGYGELRLAYTGGNQHQVSLLTRWNFATDKGALQFNYSFPTGTRNLFIYAQVWTGYGESLIDYDRSITRYGIGILLR